MHREDNAYNRLRAEFTTLSLGKLITDVTMKQVASVHEEFEMLCGDERVQVVAVGEGMLFVGTFPLIMRQVNGPTHGLEEFLIHINVAARQILCENLGGIRQYDGRSGHHPHVLGSMVPCFSTNQQLITNLFADRKLGKLGVLIIDFLELAQGSSDYVSPAAWPQLYPEEEQKWRALRRAGTNSSSRPQASTPDMSGWWVLGR